MNVENKEALVKWVCPVLRDHVDKEALLDQLVALVVLAFLVHGVQLDQLGPLENEAHQDQLGFLDHLVAQDQEDLLDQLVLRVKPVKEVPLDPLGPEDQEGQLVHLVKEVVLVKLDHLVQLGLQVQLEREESEDHQEN